MLLRPELIHRKATDIVRGCGTRDTVRIAKELGIYVHFVDGLNELLGMYTYRHKERHILLNSNMEYIVKLMVCGHEIGHDCLHREQAKGASGLQEFTLFDMRNEMEYEANAFSAHLRIDDDELMELMKQGYDVVQLSSIMETNVNLMLIKLNELNRMGWQLNVCTAFRFPQKCQAGRLIAEVLRDFLSDIFIIWDARCRNLHNPAMGLNYHARMQFEP